MNGLALFAGTISPLVDEMLGIRTVCAVERDAYCIKVLQQRQRDGVLPVFPIWDDVRTFDGKPWRGIVDVVTAGFPCQPFSVAGKRKGSDDERNGWPDTIRIIRDVRPRFAFLENVPGLLTSGYFETILTDLSEAGFNAEWEVISAAELGAPHIRKRLWMLATDSNGVKERRKSRRFGRSSREVSPVAGYDGEQRDVADAASARLERWQQSKTSRSIRSELASGYWWSSEPDVGRVVNGLPNRVDRLRALGNGWVPAVAVEAWNRLTAQSVPVNEGE